MKKVFVISGPTASGKTGLSIELAKALGGEIVSADSMQIYRGMDIGTAKATPEEQAQAVHHMIDVAEPWEDYSVARYVEEAARCCEEIFARGKLPILCGGTGLYIDSLLSGRDFAERSDSDNALREELSAEYDLRGGEYMRSLLASFDPERAAKLMPNDKKRILRAIEVYRLTGETITAHDERTKALPPRFESIRFTIDFEDRQELYERIDKRVLLMDALGLFDEVEGLLRQGISPRATAMQAIGYKEAVSALRGECTRAEALAQIALSSRRYAKRQLTWFRRDAGAVRLLRKKGGSEEELAQVSTDYLRKAGV